MDNKETDTTSFEIKPPAEWELYAYGLARALVHFVNRTAWRVEILGREKLPEGAFILAPVHRSNIDTLLVASLTKRRLRYMGKDGVWKYRVVGVILTALGGFPVHRGTADREAMRRCNAVLMGGEPLVLFPEGARKSGPIVEDLFEGAAYLASRAKVPIVPVGIGGSERALGIGMKFPRFTKILIIVGDPIYPDFGDGVTERSRVTRSTISKVTEQLKSAIQCLFDQAQNMLGLVK